MPFKSVGDHKGAFSVSFLNHKAAKAERNTKNFLAVCKILIVKKLWYALFVCFASRRAFVDENKKVLTKTRQHLPA